MRWLFVMALAACTPTPPPIATAMDAERAHVELAQLAQGRDLLVHRCGQCHDVPVPAERAAREWPAQVAAMQQKAGLDGAQRLLIEQYLVTMAPK